MIMEYILYPPAWNQEHHHSPLYNLTLVIGYNNSLDSFFNLYN